ncbi:MAG: Hsp20/alpha crystallin family protein [Deltaproteobacteria bacterium]|nr:Hsp20/alpha crystallin family protein [Deltaproteobacteria bacterium]MBN2671833.1 Hsp20/alpha crystallin family protein [Deltaproteobacteria bacterium]
MLALRTQSIPTLFDDFNTLNRFFDYRTATQGDLRPKVDVFDKGDVLVVQAELPGVNEKEIDIEFADSVLTIKAERKIIEEEGREYHRREIAGGTYTRAMKFSTPVDASKIEASYQNGVLEVRLPKDEALKPRKIAVAGA